ncbi:hypothetical protein MIMGU_mgv1a019892mg, partial [Erythranthe guttata]
FALSLSLSLSRSLTEMEFWGVEVKSGEPLKVVPGDGMVVHLSQACLGELKKEKGNGSVYLFLNVDGEKLVLGTLFPDKLPQQQFDLVFDRDFELSHNLKTGSEDDSSSEEDIPSNIANNGKPESNAKPAKPEEPKKAVAAKEKESIAGKKKVTTVEANKDVKPQEDDETSSSDYDISSDTDDPEDSDMDDSSDDSDDSSDEETPKKAETSKKRPLESATKTPVPDKKAKATPQKTDGKKGSAHVDTPHPGKQAGKTPANNKPKQQTPKSAAAHSCNSCEKKFGSEKALESHSKAKHAGGK